MRAGKIIAIGLCLSVLPGCMKQRPFGELDRPALALAEKAPDLRQERGAVLLVRITKDGSSCGVGRGRIRTLASAVFGGPSYTIGQKTSLDDLPPGEAATQKLKAVLTLNVPTLLKQTEVKPVDIAYVSIPPGDYLLTRIECAQGRTTWSMGNDFGSMDARPTGRPQLPVNGANMISIKAGEVVDAGLLDITERQRGFWKTTGEVVALPAPDPYRQMVATRLSSLATATTYRSFVPFSVCEALKRLLASQPDVAAKRCAEDAAKKAAGL
jgi:hypothetical protein